MGAMGSEAKNISSGIPWVGTKMVYFDQHQHMNDFKSLLLVHTEIDTYQQCWSVLGTHRPKPAHTPNPFLRAKHVGGPYSAPLVHHGQHSVAKAEKYVLVMDYLKRVELFVEKIGGKNRLVGMNHIDTRHDTSSSVVITGWSTEPSDEKTYHGWDSCDDERWKNNDDLGEGLDEWDLVKFFFPNEATASVTPGLTMGGSDLLGSSTVTTPPARRAMEINVDDESITV